MKKILIIIFAGIIQIGISQNVKGPSIPSPEQTPVYLNFHETFDDFSLVAKTPIDTSCLQFISNPANNPPPGTFPQSFIYQLKDKNRITPITLNDGTDCIELSVLDDDQNCNDNTSSDRSEIAFNNLINVGMGWYKLKFYIPPSFKVNNYSGEHTIFQIIKNAPVDDNTNDNIEPLVSPLPQFLIQFRHHEPGFKVKLLYGLEFDVPGAINCRGCILNINQQADYLNHYPRCGDYTKRQDIDLQINVGWNTLVFKINWSENQNLGYMDIWPNIAEGTVLDNTNRIVNPDQTASPDHTFVGSNVYNRKMIPFKNDDTGSVFYPNISYKFPNIMKFGHYRYSADFDSQIYFDYFLADKEDYNIKNNFETNILDNDGILDLSEEGEEIECDKVHNADEFIFLFEDTLFPFNQQYIGNTSPEPHILTYHNLLSSDLDLEFYKDYKVMTRARFFDGFNGKYSNPKTIRLEPDTKLTDDFCTRIDIHHNEYLQVDKIKGADGYVLYFSEVGNSSNNFYHGIPSSGSISVQAIFDAHSTLTTYKYFNINVRARFQQYGMEGAYSNPCTVMFKPVLFSEDTDSAFYPNPFQNEIHFSDVSDIDEILILDFNGSSIRVLREFNGNKIDVSDLKKEVYFLIIKKRDKTKIHKIVKNNP